MLVIGPRQTNSQDISLNHNNEIIGDGIYCTPHIQIALKYANIVKIKNKGYALILQCRVNQKNTHIVSSR
jgi:hypothetical protein